MLCTQSSFAFSFHLLSNIYNDYDNNIFLTSKSCGYNITTTKTSINVSCNAVYNLKQVMDEDIIRTFNVTTSIDFEYVEGSRIAKLLGKGIISW